jgi:hypothetical protein
MDPRNRVQKMPRPTPVNASDVPDGEVRSFELLAGTAVAVADGGSLGHVAVGAVVDDVVDVGAVDVVVEDDVLDDDGVVVLVVDVVEVLDVEEVLEVLLVAADLALLWRIACPMTEELVLDAGAVVALVLVPDGADVLVVLDVLAVAAVELVGALVLVVAHEGAVVVDVAGSVVDVVDEVVVVGHGGSVVDVVEDVLEVEDVDDVELVLELGLEHVGAVVLVVDDVVEEVDEDVVELVEDELVLDELVDDEASVLAAPAGRPLTASVPGMMKHNASPVAARRYLIALLTSCHHVVWNSGRNLSFDPCPLVRKRRREDELFATWAAAVGSNRFGTNSLLRRCRERGGATEAAAVRTPVNLGDADRHCRSNRTGRGGVARHLG